MSGKKTQQSIATEHAPYVRAFTFSDGSTMERCTLCSYGIGHAEQTPPIYTLRHHDSPVELEPAEQPESEDIDTLAERLALDAKPPAPVAGQDDDFEDMPDEPDYSDEPDAEVEKDDDIVDCGTFDEEAA